LPRAFAPHSPKRKEKHLLLRQLIKRPGQFLASQIKTLNKPGTHQPTETNRGPATVRWAATGGCIVTTTEAVMSVNRGETGECVTARQAMIATWIADVTEDLEIEIGIAPVKTDPAGITTVMRRDLGAA
jgi:hypothetical protein